MALTESTVVDQITVEENGIVLVREATRVYRDGEFLAENYKRSSYHPGQDLTGVDPRVVAIANAAWTQEVIDAYVASLPDRETE